MTCCCAGLAPPSRYARRLGALRGAALPVDTSGYAAALQSQVSAKLNAAGAQVQAQVQAETGVDTSNARVGAGAAAAADLAANGFNPQSSADQGKLIHAIAGGLALIPGPGVILAGAVEALYSVGSVIAAPVTDFFASVGLGMRSDAPPCQVKGAPWTPAGVLASAQARNALPPMPRGSFASIVVPALATYAANAANCKGGMPPGVIIDAVVTMWNRTHAGPAAPFYVPPLVASWGAMQTILIPTWQHTSGQDPNAAAAFQRLTPDKAAWLQASPSHWLYPAPPSPSSLIGLSGPRVVMVNTGALLPPPPPRVLNFHLGPPPTGAAAVLHLTPAQRDALMHWGASLKAPPAPGPSTGLVVAGVAAAALAAWYATTPAGARLLRRVTGKARRRP